jgi:chaperone modulatory protein CbpM
MSGANLMLIDSLVVEERVMFSLTELCRACAAEHHEVLALVRAGVLAPAGGGPGDWLFDGGALRTTRKALRLAEDLELSLDAVALVLDLLDRIEALEARLNRLS